MDINKSEYSYTSRPRKQLPKRKEKKKRTKRLTKLARRKEGPVRTIYCNELDNL